MCVVCREGAVNDGMCQKYFVESHDGDFSPDSAPRSGRPVEVDSDRIETFIKNNQCCTRQEIVDTFKISKSIKLFLKIKNICLLFYGKIKQIFRPTQYIQVKNAHYITFN